MPPLDRIDHAILRHEAKPQVRVDRMRRQLDGGDDE
jgi:hypothetical protein